MFNKDTWILIGATVTGAIAGGLIGRHLGKTIGKIQTDIGLMDRRIIELEVKALGPAVTDNIEQREEYASLVVALLADKLRQGQKVLPVDGNAKIHELRNQFSANEITVEELVKGLLHDVYRSAI